MVKQAKDSKANVVAAAVAPAKVEKERKKGRHHGGVVARRRVRQWQVGVHQTSPLFRDTTISRLARISADGRKAREFMLSRSARNLLRTGLEAVVTRQLRRSKVFLSVAGLKTLEPLYIDAVTRITDMLL